MPRGHLIDFIDNGLSAIGKDLDHYRVDSSAWTADNIRENAITIAVMCDELYKRHKN